MVTGKLALPEDEEATMPTDLTVPKTLVVLPVGVISACRPFFSWGRSALVTLASTTHEVVEMTMTWAVEEAPDELEAPEAPEELDDPPELEEPPVLSPTAMFTCATVPAIGEVIAASARAVCASVSLLLAAAT